MVLNYSVGPCSVETQAESITVHLDNITDKTGWHIALTENNRDR